MEARSSLLMAVVAVGIGSPALFLAPRVAQAAPMCSLGTLGGDYLGNVSGTTASAGAFGLQYHLRLDGDGTGTLVRALLVTEDASGPVLFVGRVTYTLSAECTGSLVVTSDSNVSTYGIAVADMGSEIALLAVSRGVVGTGVLKDRR